MEGVEASGRKEQRKRETNILEFCDGYGGLRVYVLVGEEEKWNEDMWS